MAKYTFGKDFAIRTEEDCIATEDVFGPYVGRITAVKIKTNADRIRSMTDEELAKELERIDDTACAFNRPWTYEGWLEWLRKEVEDD